MGRQIPQPVISVLSEHMADQETHATLNSLFMYADAPGDAPDMSKSAKAQEWLRRINKECDDPLAILGRLLEGYMEADLPDRTVYSWEKNKSDFIEKMTDLLGRYGLRYMTGGHISDGASITSISLKEAIGKRNIPAVEMEFSRALENIHTDPREAVSAACNIMESTFKVYIADEKLQAPAKQDLQGLWKVVRDSLGLDTKAIEDEDLKRILSGLYSLTDGIGALRTHASSAHGAGRKIYNLKPRHARLAINAAHTLTMFILESWDEKKNPAS
ncbi:MULTISPECIES: abortive infection family protein [Pectobacterium]|uniref:ATP-dependent RNA helicase HrpA n=1 Tax=Pectobacterium parvum TaxID=2778550 RepID=A0AAP9IHT0_9GAMM|nr:MULTISPECIES: abortive infection family protein [Pectobacterium]PWD64908.1 ATP-dependent RNA helicase HrpA [Pectobacterium parmentieri]QHQ24947.1 ATP-dependent RNA helicase HrpA [Pectobacterium parvum]